MTRFAAPIAEQIWDMKYRFKQADGTPIDNTVEDSWHRIAGALASVESSPEAWEPKFLTRFQILNSCQQVVSLPVQVRNAASHCSTVLLWAQYQTAWVASLICSKKQH